MIIDCFTYYNEEELLELRINALNDYVDKFIIMEGNMSYTGILKPFSCKTTLEKLGINSDKIVVIEVILPADGDVEPSEVDMTYYSRLSKTKDTNFFAASRERLLRNSLLNVIENYAEDDVFIFSDCDEIIKPDAINYFASVARVQSDMVVKVPLVTLEGRADLRLHNRSTQEPLDTNNVMFVCTKKQLQNCPPFSIRFNIHNVYQEGFLTENGIPIKECGWHFTWIGDADRKIHKLKSFSHHADYIHFAKVPNLASPEMVEFLKNHKVAEGTINPWGNSTTIMKKYPKENLPKEIFELPRVKEYLLTGESTIDLLAPVPVMGTLIVNGVHWLQRLIDSIDYPIDEFVIFNNNGRGEIDSELDKIVKIPHQYIKKMRVCHLPRNFGVAGGWNMIIKSYIMAPYWIVVNNDIKFSPGFILEMVKKAKDEDVGIVHCSSGGDGLGSFECFLIKDWVVQSHGLFDENFYPAYVEDYDYIMRVLAKPIKRDFVNLPFLHGETDYANSGSQTWRTDLTLKDKITNSRLLNEYQYMPLKWGDDWRSNAPYKNPFNVIDYPVSYTKFDLNFQRKKYMGF
jgi:beta-1,4-mannosyl-glycoprotein beta-1,4-N-acetylglucosaminyltransferase